jgi:hypothetical protein
VQIMNDGVCFTEHEEHEVAWEVAVATSEN